MSAKLKTFILQKPTGFRKTCHDVIIYRDDVIVDKMTRHFFVLFTLVFD